MKFYCQKSGALQLNEQWISEDWRLFWELEMRNRFIVPCISVIQTDLLIIRHILLEGRLLDTREDSLMG